MNITFSTDLDYKPMRHVSVRSRKDNELALVAMPTAAEAALWANREVTVPRVMRVWQPTYDDGVESRRDAEKARGDAEARLRLVTDPVTTLDDLKAVKVRPERITTSTQRIISEIVRIAPSELRWSHTMSHLPSSQILSMAHRCREPSDPAFAWGLNVRLMDPAFPSPMRHVARSIYTNPDCKSGNRMNTPGLTPKRSDRAQVTEWMQAAEENRIPGRSTVCAITGKSLVVKTNFFGRHSWSLDTAFQGMSMEAAQQVASAAAIQAGLVRGVVRGSPPLVVERLRNNANDWLGLVIATRHPLFYIAASRLMKMGGDFKFSDNTEDNRVEWERISSATKAEAVPDSRQDA